MNEEAYLLIVDDNLENLNVIGNILKDKHYKIALARNGVSALQILDEIEIDLILLDIMMPDMDGYEVCSRIKKNSALEDIPVIFISALNETKDIVKGFNCGGIDYITKPFKAEEIIARVDTHLKIRKQNMELKMLNANKDLFISILAHDLKNPFNHLINFSDILLKNFRLTEIQEIEKKLGIIHNLSVSLYSLVDDTLLWARAQSGRITYNPENINLSKLCDEIISQLILEQEAKNISVKCLFAQDLMVYADSFMLHIILRNLLGNAIKFSNTSDIIIISAEKDRTGVTIAVTDNGVGINPERIKRLFDITQVYSTKGTANEKGTGLGLIICKDFVKMHKGKIWVESEKNIGSTFKFYLPFK